MTSRISRSRVSTGLPFHELVRAFERETCFWDFDRACGLMGSGLAVLRAHLSAMRSPHGLMVISKGCQRAAGERARCAHYLVGDASTAAAMLGMEREEAFAVPVHVTLHDGEASSQSVIVYDTASSIMRALDCSWWSTQAAEQMDRRMERLVDRLLSTTVSRCARMPASDPALEMR